eukprot:182385-Rhodomonas_salina.1
MPSFEGRFLLSRFDFGARVQSVGAGSAAAFEQKQTRVRATGLERGGQRGRGQSTREAQGEPDCLRCEIKCTCQSYWFQVYG